MRGVAGSEGKVGQTADPQAAIGQPGAGQAARRQRDGHRRCPGRQVGEQRADSGHLA